MSDDPIPTVNARHEIGLVAAARLVAIFWCGLVPIVFPAWLIVQAEIARQNTVQDVGTKREYISRSEFDERMRLLDERARVSAELLREIREEQRAQREILMRATQRR